ncbi:fumarylacetoacetate hydrolase family protein [Rhodococcus globerulus]|uniref:Fumarylacetoacetate hydrolase family protein n=1 Tax=Rhodococcus globerulus TaxID=33008 RepID=A0ABU4C3V3_RHOGO|nr:fumarylacetoacetate hydrolase family protein [Rhodococcus globerulus]MDV6271182.1 fumarylacetoacetate hydrolase family protein [Rhodococcus globerulus]
MSSQRLKFGRLGSRGNEFPVVSAGNALYDLRHLATDLDGPFLQTAFAARTRAALDAGELLEVDKAETYRVGAPIHAPGKIVCIGLNYRDHAHETGAVIPTEPVVFMKDPSTIIGPYDEVLVPRNSQKTDWEVELGVVIGQTARYLTSPAEALHHVAGYVISHDVSEREFQLERGGQWDKGKSCETFNPLGPWLIPSNQMNNPQDLRLSLDVNGIRRQDGTTANMIFDVAHIIWYLSQFMVLRPGDLINTGTPAGVAMGMPDTPYLKPGDVVQLEISGLGSARQTVGAA